MANFVHIEIFMLKSNCLFYDKELVSEKKWIYRLIFIEFLILVSITQNLIGQPFL